MRRVVECKTKSLSVNPFRSWGFPWLRQSSLNFHGGRTSKIHSSCQTRIISDNSTNDSRVNFFVISTLIGWQNLKQSEQPIGSKLSQVASRKVQLCQQAHHPEQLVQAQEQREQHKLQVKPPSGRPSSAQEQRVQHKLYVKPLQWQTKAVKHHTKTVFKFRSTVQSLISYLSNQYVTM